MSTTLLLPADSTATLARRRWAALVLLVCGAVLFAIEFLRPAGPNGFVYLSVGPWRPRGLLVVFGLAAACTRWDPLRRWFAPDRPADARASLAAAVLAGIFLWVSAVAQHRQLFPYVADESSYLIQAHQLARGHLWYPAHPLGLSFDSFQLLTRGRVYASCYFPGTALLYVPGVWLGVAPYFTTLIIAAAVVGLTHWLASRCVDRSAAWLAVLLLLACPMFRTLSVITMGQLPLLLYALAAVVAWVHWCEGGGSLRSAVATGAILGLAAITRPVDALCFAIPIALGSVAVWLNGRVDRRGLLIGCLGVVAGALPCGVVQAITNRGITGDWSLTPFRLYADLDYPNTAYGFHRFDPLARPASPLPQKQALYRTEVRPELFAHRLDRAWGTAVHFRLPLLLSLGGAVTPFPMLAMLWPAAWATVSRRDPLRAVLLATLPLFLLLYVPYVFFFPHYTVSVLPAFVLGITLVVGRLPLLWEKHGLTMRRFSCWFVAILAIAAFPFFDADPDDLFNAPLLLDVNRQVAQIHEPAIVLFRYSAARNVDEEPVYNADVAWPDDAWVIRAHDLDPLQNARLLRYYGRLAPGRIVYRYDEATRTLTRLGPVSALSAL